MRWFVVVLIGLAAAGCCTRLWRQLAGSRAGVCVFVEGAPAGEAWGLTLDGERQGDFVDNLTLRGPDTPQHIGRFATSPRSNMIACFCRDRLPHIRRKATWTDAGREIHVPLKPAEPILLTVWIVEGPYDEVEAAAIDAVAFAATRLSEERTGIRIAPANFQDATSNDNRDSFLSFETADKKEMVRSEADGGIGFCEGTINVYYVRSVATDGAETSSDGTALPVEFHSGTSAGGWDFIAIAAHAGETLLAHELGHCMRLQHADLEPEHFDETNVMWSAGSARRYLAEGQLFRAHVYDMSTLNFVFGFHPPEELYSLLDPPSSAEAPPIWWRIFPDGPEWPADEGEAP